MDPVLTDLSTPALQRAIKENLFEFCRAAAVLPGGELQEDDSFVRWTFGVPYPWYNAVLARRPGDLHDRDRVLAAIEYFRAKEMGPFVWWLAPGITNTDWDSVLKPFGFRYTDDTPGMAADLSALNEEIVTMPDLQIVLVDNDGVLMTWAATFAKGYGLPAEFSEPIFRLMAGFGYDGANRNYLGLLNGQPVATANVYFGAGVAGIQMVATLPEARGKGIGAAITLWPLVEARKMGYRAGILQSSEMGFAVYKRLGFKQLCGMEHYYLPISG